MRRLDQAVKRTVGSRNGAVAGGLTAAGLGVVVGAGIGGWPAALGCMVLAALAGGAAGWRAFRP